MTQLSRRLSLRLRSSEAPPSTKLPRLARLAALCSLLVLGAPLAHGQQVSLPVTFEDGDAAFYELTDFGGNASTLAADPTDATNTVVESVRQAGAAFFAGTTVADATGFADPIPFADGATTMSVRVWSPAAGVPVRFKVEKFDTPEISVEAECPTTVAGGWETIVYDFVTDKVDGTADINFASEYTKATIFFNFGEDGAPDATTYYWDDVAFGGTPVAGGCRNASGGNTIADARAAEVGAEVTFSGVVTRAMGAFAYVQDATAGITIRQTSGDFFDDVADGTIAPGTEVTITGTTSEFASLLQISGGGLAEYSVDGVTGVPAAQRITLAELNANGEAYEAELVEVVGLTTAATGTFDAAETYTANDGTADGDLRIPSADDSMIDGTEIPAVPFTFTGVAGQFNFSDPTAGYQLLAIAPGDIVPEPQSAVSLPITFEDGDAAFYELTDFGGNASTLAADPTDATNTVVESVRQAGAAFFAGTTVADATGFADPIPFADGATTMSVRVWSPAAGVPVRFKVEKFDTPEISVEAECPTTVAGGWETIVYDFVTDKVDGTADINFASEYTKATIFFNFGEDGAPDATTYYWDDVAFGGMPVAGGCRNAVTGDEIALPITFEDGDAAFYELTDFGGNASTLAADPTDATNTVVESVRQAGAAFFAGTTVADATGFADPIPFADGATTMSVRVWSPAAGVPVRFKVEKFDTPEISVEAECPTTVAGGWETIVYDFVTDKVDGTADINFASEYTKATIFFNFGEDGAPDATTYYWDDVAFGGTPVAGGCRNASGGNTIADARAAEVGSEVTFSGVVTRAMGAFAYVQDATAGITIRQTSGDFFDDVADGTIAPGTEVTITGTTSEFASLLQISGGGLAEYSVDGVTGVPAAQRITLAELNANGEAYEAELVEVVGLTTAATGTFDAAETYTANDGTADGDLRIPNADDSMIDGTEIPAVPFTFTGVAGQFNFSDPTAGYQLLAIAPGDIVPQPQPVVSLPVTFEDGDAEFYELTDFGGNESSLVADPTNSDNTVVQSLRPAATAACFAGTTVAEELGFIEPIPFEAGQTFMNLRVWAPEVGTTVRLKVEKFDTPEISVEAEVATTTAGAWEVLVFDFVDDKVPGTADINFASEYTKASVFFDFTCGIDPPPPAPADPTYYWDDLTFGTMPPVAGETPVAGTPESGLTQNAPNPFSETTAIQFSLSTQGHVRLRVFNHLGQEVATLVDGPMAAGSHAVPFDASGLASGMYIYRLSHGDVTETRTMILAR